jgi:hypothetical protein
MQNDGETGHDRERWRRIVLAAVAVGVSVAVLLALPDVTAAITRPLRAWLWHWEPIAWILGIISVLGIPFARRGALRAILALGDCFEDLLVRCERYLDALLGGSQTGEPGTASTSGAPCTIQDREIRHVVSGLSRVVGRLTAVRAIARDRALERLPDLVRSWASVSDRLDRSSLGECASLAIGAGGSFLVATACVVMLATWVPHYLTWPWWCDIDQFAVSAQSWDAGILPYRDQPDFDFPGPIYLCWLLGKAFGWGRTAPMYAVDVALLVGLGMALTAWSKRRFGRALPGLVGFLLLLVYYLNLPYWLVAQRDWRAPLFAVLSVMILEARPGRIARLVSAGLFAVSLSFRPHCALFMPALVSALEENLHLEPQPHTPLRKAFLEWAAAFALGLLLAFAPLVYAGVLDDFVRALATAHYGTGYGKAKLYLLPTLLRDQLAEWQTVLTFGVLLALVGAPPFRRTARTWVCALLGIALYKPLSPVVHAYMNHPLYMVWSVNIAIATAWFLATPWLSSPLRVLCLALLLRSGIPILPQFCSIERSLEAVGSLMRGEEPRRAPNGCELMISSRTDRPTHYRWDDYRNLLDYLRHSTAPNSRVANFLRALPFPSVNGPAGRLTAFPAAGGILYLGQCDRTAEIRCAEALERVPEGLVVWVPREECVDNPNIYPNMVKAIEAHYVPLARFGIIEVWRKKGRGRPRGKVVAHMATTAQPRRAAGFFANRARSFMHRSQEAQTGHGTTAPSDQLRPRLDIFGRFAMIVQRCHRLSNPTEEVP